LVDCGCLAGLTIILSKFIKSIISIDPGSDLTLLVDEAALSRNEEASELQKNGLVAREECLEDVEAFLESE